MSKQALVDLIANDAYAMSFQSMGQYRTALIKDACSAPAAGGCTKPGCFPYCDCGSIDDAPPATDEVSVPRAHADVLAERRRQVEAEGFDGGHDDMATRGQLSRAAGLYALHAHDPLNLMLQYAPPQWPWDASWWKPAEPRRMLVKSAALVLAEIERIDRGLLAQGVK